MAGKPVIVNGSCAAFHDLASNHYNALIVDDALSLQEAIARLMDDPELCNRLAKNGKEILWNYDWSNIGSLFVKHCNELIKNSRPIKGSDNSKSNRTADET